MSDASAMRTRRGYLVPLIVVVTTVGLATGLLAASLPAAAAITGAGIRGITPYGGYLGNYIAPDGMRVYCIDAKRDWPSGPTGDGYVTGEITTESGASLDAATLQRLNFVLANYGQTSEPELAAAVNAYLYAFTSGRARSHGAGYSTGLYFINGNRGVEAAFATVWSAAEASMASALGSPTASLTIELGSPRDGLVRVTTNPRGAVGTLELTGAVVAETGERSIDVADGAVVAIRGVPVAGEFAYAIAASAQFRAPAAPGPAVTLYLTGTQQRTIRHAEPTQLAFEAVTTLGPITLEFAPQLESLVEKSTVAVGEPLVDSLSVTLVDPDQGWLESDGVPLPVVAVGTLYGPFQAEPELADGPPADAPVTATTRITLTGTGTYVSDGISGVTEGGYYTWVWRIEAADQSEATSLALGADFLFADRFGLPNETVRVVRTPELAATGVPALGMDTLGKAGAGFALLIAGILVVASRREYREN